MDAGFDDDDLYDEFGNYVGPPLSDDEDDAVDGLAGGLSDEEARADQRLAYTEGGPISDGNGEEDAEADGLGGVGAGAVVLHEDKRYYADAEEVYGEHVETLVEDEDAQALEDALVRSISAKTWQIQEPAGAPPATAASRDFLVGLMSTPALIRHVAILGHLHHGKTSLVDMFVEQTHDWAPEIRSGTGSDADAGMGRARYTDTRIDEQRRGLSIKATPMSLVMPDLRGKSFLMNVCDAPGHPNFQDEAAAALRLCDGAMLVVDAAEGVMMQTRTLLAMAVRQGLALTLVINKVDRLILELKLPPRDAYHKLRHTLEELNAHLASCPGGEAYPPFDPAAGNVAFASAAHGWSLTPLSVARMYAEIRGVPIDAPRFAAKLWGDWHMDPTTRAFKRTSAFPKGQAPDRGFVQFVLEPLYKIYSAVVGEEEAEVQAMLLDFGVSLKPAVFKQDVKPLLKSVCCAVFGGAEGIVAMLTEHVPSPVAGTALKVAQHYTGPQEGALVDAMTACRPQGPLVVSVLKLFPNAACDAFDALGRVMSGTIRAGERVRVLGEGYSPEDEEDSAVVTTGSLWALQGRYRLPLPKACAGNWVLIQGIDATIAKTATVVHEHYAADGDAYVFEPLRFATTPTVRTATEPVNPQDLPKMLEGLRRISKSYPCALTKVEESGEHAIVGTGELYLDCVLKDLRELFSDVEVKVADPGVCFAETVAETSALKCFASTPNKRNKITMVAEPLDAGLAADVASDVDVVSWPKKRLAKHLEQKYAWDAMAARSVWAFGPEPRGPNALLDDTLAGDVDKALVRAIRSAVVQGFQWGAREGPLCDEPMREVKFKLLEATVAPEAMHRSSGQLIPTARRVTYSAFLTATPRLMEPIYAVDIQCPGDCMEGIRNILQRRRGHVLREAPKPGTPIYSVQAQLPVIESFGFETDLRYHTQGACFCVSAFDHWRVVPGDPLDASIALKPLEPAPIPHLAREFMVKTRRRKGMSEDVGVAKFFDDPDLLNAVSQEIGLGLPI